MIHVYTYMHAKAERRRRREVRRAVTPSLPRDTCMHALLQRARGRHAGIREEPERQKGQKRVREKKGWKEGERGKEGRR